MTVEIGECARCYAHVACRADHDPSCGLYTTDTVQDGDSL